jgi:hypothetical protein
MTTYFTDEKGKKSKKLDLYSLGHTPKGTFTFEFDNDYIKEHFNNQLIKLNMAQTSIKINSKFEYNRFVDLDLSITNYEQVGIHFDDLYEDIFFGIWDLAWRSYGYIPQKYLAFQDQEHFELFAQNNPEYKPSEVLATMLAVNLMYNYGTFPNGFLAYNYSPVEYQDLSLDELSQKLKQENHRKVMSRFGTALNRIPKDIYSSVGQKKYGGYLIGKGQEIAKGYLEFTKQRDLIDVLVQSYSFGKEEKPIEEI